MAIRGAVLICLKMFKALQVGSHDQGQILQSVGDGHESKSDIAM